MPKNRPKQTTADEKCFEIELCKKVFNYELLASKFLIFFEYKKNRKIGLHVSLRLRHFFASI